MEVRSGGKKYFHSLSILFVSTLSKHQSVVAQRLDRSTTSLALTRLTDMDSQLSSSPRTGCPTHIFIPSTEDIISVFNYINLIVPAFTTGHHGLCCSMGDIAPAAYSMMVLLPMEAIRLWIWN
ncbi:hypothetical protein CEXT_774311 [Caerostris extrusa]|uniref:Uncharacterized protein n=1 Tax=Caerostris extrusa TaxID=172846 RepID=A0AAV4NIQ5_CAEEX|nr:hypothetical protein CEXT_774311 [Caerostris extrusa]